VFCPLCSSVPAVVQPFSYAATPSGYTLGETALNPNEIYRPDEIKGQAISAFVSLEHGIEPTNALKEELKKWVGKEIGSLAKPDDIRFTDMLPKTRSGKIMRRLLRELASSGEVKGDTTTLEDFGVIAKLKEQDEV
jgi:acetyl-CoA synthetase